MKRIHCEAVDRNQYWVAFQEEEEEENGCITGKWGRGRENLWKSWRHMNWEKAADETTVHCSGAGEVHELRKRYTEQRCSRCSGAGELEVREITGVLAHDIHLLRVLASDIHLLNLKSKAKCTFEAAAWGIRECQVSTALARNSPQAPPGFNWLKARVKALFLPYGESYVSAWNFYPEIKKWIPLWNQIMTKT